MRYALALAVAVALACFSGTANAAPPCTSTAMSLGAPDRLAYGREGAVVLSNTESIDSAHLDYIQPATGRVVFAHDFSSDELNAGLGGGEVRFPLRFSSGSLIVRLTYTGTQTEYIAEPPYSVEKPCQDAAKKTVEGVLGVRPRVKADYAVGNGHEDAVLRVVNPSGCDGAALIPIRVTLRRRGKKAVYSLPDPCKKRGWRRRGRLRAVAS